MDPSPIEEPTWSARRPPFAETDKGAPIAVEDHGTFDCATSTARRTRLNRKTEKSRRGQHQCSSAAGGDGTDLGCVSAVFVPIC